MKKFLTVFCAVAVAGAINSASAMDRAGKIGLGFQENFMSSGVFGSSFLGTVSVKYGVTSNITGQFMFGFDMWTKGNDKSFDFGARLLYDLVEKENSDFYTGLGVGYTWNKVVAAFPAVDNGRAVRVNLPLGFEWSFAGLPEVGFNAEVGVMLDYNKATKAWGFQSAGGTIGGALGLGVHYYF